MKKHDWIIEQILYRDALILVLNKPAGIPVHKGTGGGENLEQHFEHLRFGLPRTPALAHRLDRDTSGCLILGRHRQALAKLGKLFEHNKIRKTYWAIVEGKPPADSGTIDLPLAKKSEQSNRWQMKVDKETGQQAITEYKVMGKFLIPSPAGGGLGWGHPREDGTNNAPHPASPLRGEGKEITWLEMYPLTGRTHQLRVHCAAIGCPILGDKIYGTASETKLHLHARAIDIPLYPKKDAIHAEAPPPEHMVEALRGCGFK